MYHSLFKRLPIERHMGCFQFLSISNKSAIKIYLQASCEHKGTFLWNKCLGIQWLSHIVVECLVLKEIISFPKPLNIYVPSSNSWEIKFFHTSSAFGVVTLSYSHTFNRCMIIPLCGFNLLFLNGYDVKRFIICLFATCISSLVKYLFIPLSIFLIGFLIIVELWEFSVLIFINILMNIYVLLSLIYVPWW